MSLYASRQAGTSLTECRWPTTPQARQKPSKPSDSAPAKSAQVAGVLSAVSCAISARPSASRDSMAGLTCSGWIRSKRGRSEKSSSGFVAVVIVVGARKRAVCAARSGDGKSLFYKLAVGVPRGVAKNRHDHHQPEQQGGEAE